LRSLAETAFFCQDYFFKFPTFLLGLALGLRLTFALFLLLLSRLAVNSQSLVAWACDHHIPRAPAAFRTALALSPIR
jgi:hypothetical protein